VPAVLLAVEHVIHQVHGARQSAEHDERGAGLQDRRWITQPLRKNESAEDEQILCPLPGTKGVEEVQGNVSGADRGKATNSFGLCIERLKHCQQLHDGQQVADAAGESQQLQRPALAADRREGADDFPSPALSR